MPDASSVQPFPLKKVLLGVLAGVVLISLATCGIGYFLVRRAVGTAATAMHGVNADLDSAAKEVGFDSSAALINDAMNGSHGIMAKADEILGARWQQARLATEKVMTDEGAAALYRATPALASTFSTEADFMREMQELRPKLARLPEERPQTTSKDFGYSVKPVADRRLGVLRYRNSKLNLILYYFEGSELTAIKQN